MQKDSSNPNNKGKERKILQREGGPARSGGNNNFRRGDEKGHGMAELKVNSRAVVIESIKVGNNNNAVGRVRDNETYGIVISIKQGFGFIQSIFSDEQVYFSEREYYQNIKVNDLVGYVPTQGPKGPAAQNVRALIPQISKILTNVEGTIVRSNERHRVGCGIVDVGNLTGIDAEAKNLLKTKYNNQIAYRAHDIIATSLPKNHYLDRGDVVTMTLSRMHDSNFFLATEVSLKQLKRDKVMSDQIQRMLDAGVTREIGVISTVKNKEYGFIRAQDRKEEIFFRVDDVTETNGKEIVEGVEMEFFVIAEMIRGRLCDRATYLKVIPTGTVQYEVVVASDISLVVTKEPDGEESPGTGKLQHAVDISELMKSAGTTSSSIKEIDLWQRCLPDDMLIRKGDTLVIHVHFYRPEKIFFARSVRIGQYLLLGRDTGVICAIKDNNLFGFITSDSREIDLYFRLNAVVDSKGSALSSNEVKKGMKVSFDVVVEEGKFRAIRVQQVLDNHGSKDESSRYVLKKNVPGTILRNVLANRKGAIGYVELTPPKWKEINDLVFLDPQLVASIANFMNNDTLQEAEIHGLPVSIRRAYYDILDKLFPSLRHESVSIPAMEKIANLDNNAVFKTLKIWKEGKSANPENTQDLNTLTKDGKPKGGYILTFGKDDLVMNDGFVGPMPGNVEVLFDVWWDKTKGRKAAKNIRLTDEAIPDMTGEYTGIIDVLFEKGAKHGIVRMIPTDESIMFSAGSVAPAVVTPPAAPVTDNATPAEAAAATIPSPPAAPVSAKDLKVGSEVIFTLRKRGGYRYAVNVRPVQSQSTPLVLPDLCLAVVIDTQLAILVDANNVKDLKEKYLDLASLERLFSTYQENNPANVANTTKAMRSLSLRSEDGNVSSTTAVASTNATADSETTTPIPTALDEVEVDAETIAITTAIKGIPANANYFPPLLRQAILLKPPSPAIEYKVGDVVACQCEVQFAQSRVPIALIVKEVVSTAKAIKRQGKLSQWKFRIKPDLAHLPALEKLLNPRYNYTTLDFTEIGVEGETSTDTTSSSSATTGSGLNKQVYALSQELTIPDFYREAMKPGVDVEFWAIPSLSASVVFGVTVVPSKDSMLFSRGGPGINDKLKEIKAKAGTVMTLITMAEGPPNENAKGFQEGWRAIDKEKIALLPWTNALLTHLQN